jgi:pseudaminic acid biosynthesis-associated methylase
MTERRFNTPEEIFWKDEYANDYIAKNSEFDNSLGAKAWELMLKKVKPEISSFLECGCNIGRNIYQLATVLPEAEKSIIEISKPAFNYVTSNFQFKLSFNGPILESDFEKNSFDLVFTMGVLIHINPDDLLKTMSFMNNYSKKYILMGECFNRTPVMIEYQGKVNKLYKRDFGKLFIENFSVKLVDYGFLWGHIYDPAGFDDVTWWLFEKV